MILNENLFEDSLKENYEAMWINGVSYSDPIMQQYADFVNDAIYSAFDNINVLALSKIDGLPEVDDYETDNISKAISNLVKIATDEYFKNILKNESLESLNEVKIADEIRAKQDTKEMTKRAIKMLKNLGGDYEDLAKEFKDAYGEDPLEESLREAFRGYVEMSYWGDVLCDLLDNNKVKDVKEVLIDLIYRTYSSDIQDLLETSYKNGLLNITEDEYNNLGIENKDQYGRYKVTADTPDTSKKDESLKESARKTVFEVHIDLGFQERVEKYYEISDVIERVSKLVELLKKPSMSGMKVILMRGYDDEKSFDRPTVRTESWSAKGSFESLKEVKIADKIRANQNTKEMTKRAIKILKAAGGDYEDLAKEFKDTYGEDPLEESVENSDLHFVKRAFSYDIYKDGNSYVLLDGEGDVVYTSDNTLDCLKWAKKNSSKAWNFNNVWDWDRLKESVKLGGGMSLPYDDNYCIFVNSSKKTTYITKVNSKKEFASCESRYGSFVGVEKSLEDAKEYIASFNGPAKDNKVVIDS